MKYETGKIYKFENIQDKSLRFFKFVEGDWVDMVNGELYDSVSIFDQWVLIPD